ncbi:MAG: PspC domain-containing protein [Methylocystaceae bacterium]
MKQLRRSKNNQMIAGVAGGLAEYFDIDVALVRLVWVLAVLAAGTGILAYIILWIVLPEEISNQSTETAGDWIENNSANDQMEDNSSHQRRQRNAGVLLIALGLVFLGGQFIPHWVISRSWPLLLVVIGLYLLFRQKGE